MSLGSAGSARPLLNHSMSALLGYTLSQLVQDKRPTGFCLLVTPQ
jgi:hypothetical protein